MQRLVDKYARKLEAAGLVDPGEPLIGGLDAEVYWSRDDPFVPVLEEVYTRLNINSLLCCHPAEPYRAMIRHLAASAEGGAIRPRDTETRTFLHEIPVAVAETSEEIARALSRRKSVVLPSGRVVTFGTVSPEQAFIYYSSVLFACFVKFMSDRLEDRRFGRRDPRAAEILEESIPALPRMAEEAPRLAHGPFETEGAVHAAMIQVGEQTVEHGLVDSFFGNVSYLLGDTLYISQTTSSLDELAGCIDPCPVDGSSSAAITASSELSSHLQIVSAGDVRAVLHGHPKFAVILSMDCFEPGCDRSRCHTHCDKERFFEDIPIIPGEVGTGKTGLSNTLPPAIAGRRGAIVYGHGLFTVARADYGDALGRMLDIERGCMEAFLDRMGLTEH